MEHLQQIQNDYDTNPNVQVLAVLFKPGGTLTTADVDGMLASTTATITIPLLMDDGTVKPAYMTGYVGPSIGYPFSYIISRANLVANKWHRLSTSNGALICFDSANLTDTEYFVRHRIDDLLIDRTPWDTVLALDYSGSMAGHTTVGSVTQPKIDFLREAASTLLKVWKDYALCLDRIGVVYFRCHATTDGSLLEILPGGNVENLISDIEAEGATGCTAMGAGVATALDILESSSNRRFVIVFSDGMQNRNPLVYVAAITNGGATCYERWINNIGPAEYPPPLTNLCTCVLGDAGQSDYAGPLPVVLEGIDVPIHTIGIGAPAAWQAMLEAMSLASFGQFRMDVDIWPNLKEFFIETLVELYRGSSLQVVAKERGTLETGTEAVSETFKLNRSVKKLTVLLSWVGEETPLTFKLRKDGTTVDLSHKVTEDATFRFSTMAFPHYQVTKMALPPAYRRISARPKRAASLETTAAASEFKLEMAPWAFENVIGPEADWEVTIERTYPGDQAAVPYHLMVLADDKALEYKFILPQRVFYAGDTIPIGVEVLENGRPLDKIFATEVVVSRPTVAVGSLLAKYKATGKRAEAASGYPDGPSGPLAEKVEAMMSDEKAMASLATVERENVKLSKVWKTTGGKRVGTAGRLQGSYYKTEVPGVYRVDFKVRGVGKRCGVFERTESRTVFVHVRADWDATDFKTRYEKEKNRLSVTVTPADKYGNLLGPGCSGLMRFGVKGQPAGEVVDNMDGSYTIDVKLPKGEELNRLEAEFDVLGEKFFAGSVGKFVESAKGRTKG